MAYKYQFENLEDRAKIQKICDYFQLGRILKWTSLQILAPCKSLMKLQTNQGTYSFKEYTSLKKKQLEKVFYIKKIFDFQHNQNDAVNNFIYEDESSCWSIAPWVFGQCLKLKDISETHIEQIAKILGKIHKLNINFPEAPDVLSDHIDAADFELDKIVPKFTYWRNSFEQHASLLKENRVISHGDLLPQNVIWVSEQNPVLIDWNNAGQINQDIDLFNTAINWAGIESGVLNKLLYDYFIEIYLIENPRKIEINQDLIAASMGSWLNWVVFNDRLGNKKAVEITFRALEILEREFF